MTSSKQKPTLLIIFLSLMFLMPSCASKMSLEEAKRVSIAMAELPAFKPPPRRIDDVVKILDQPALALSAASVTGEKSDGLLTMTDIMKLKLNADWIVLSACNTGAAGGSGAEALSGLGRAFFYGGSRALLASMYPVETTSARRLVKGLFVHQAGDLQLTRSQALRKSMLELIYRETLNDGASGKVIASYAHPLFWAPFVVVGDPGASR